MPGIAGLSGLSDAVANIPLDALVGISPELFSSISPDALGALLLSKFQICQFLWWIQFRTIRLF